MSRSSPRCICLYGQRQLDSFQAQGLGHLSRNSPTILSPTIFGRLSLRSRSPSRFLSSADSSPSIFSDRKDFALTPVLTSDFLVWRINSRHSESGSPTPAINVATAQPPALQTSSSTRR